MWILLGFYYDDSAYLIKCDDTWAVNSLLILKGYQLKQVARERRCCDHGV